MLILAKLTPVLCHFSSLSLVFFEFIEEKIPEHILLGEGFTPMEF